MEDKILTEAQIKENIGIGAIPLQGPTQDLIPLQEALLIGTIFRELHKPFYLGGDGGGR